MPALLCEWMTKEIAIQREQAITQKGIAWTERFIEKQPLYSSDQVPQVK